MSNQIVISSGAKVRELEGVLTGTAGIVNALSINVPNGIPQLDGSGKILVSQLPNSVMEYKGTWNAATNTPTLVNGTGNQGDVYLCNVAGTVDFGAGPIVFFVGDQVIYSGTIWQRASGASGTVTSVAVTESGDALTITGSPITTSGTINIGFAGNSGQYVNGAGGLTTFPTLISSIGLSMPSAFNVANSPLTANGTIAVTGAGVASQYIRGDGTLANFPTSGGGGSSVSYYLNGSINQGTIGGVTYYEMNKVPVIGAGTDFSRGSNGYIASFLTDANDPALLEIPAGNWNFETYFNASSGGGSPTFYIELYKYDGTTFTLIASNSAFPKLINDGTSIEAYFSALAVPQTSLTLTDRLAVRIYVTTAGRTITLHTENSHLCQVITTFSTGLTALNGLTAQVQYFGTGTSGTDFNISSSTATHTFNIPDASATNRGLITTGIQTIAGSKTFSSAITGDSGIALKEGVIPSAVGYTGLAGDADGLLITKRVGSTGYTNLLSFTSATSNTYTYPNASGTLALTSNLSSYVPYTGATGDVFLGANSISGAISTFQQGVFNGNGTNPANIYLKKGSSPFFTNANNYGLIAAVSSSFILVSDVDGANYKYASFNLGSLTNNTNRAFTLPDASGTLALLEGTQTFTGLKSFDTGLLLKNGFTPTTSGYLGIGSGTNGINISLGAGGGGSLIFQSTSYNYTFPAASGTIALTSDLSSYVTLATAQTISGGKTFSASPIIDGGFSTAIPLRFKQYDAATFNADGYTDLYVINAYRFGFSFNQGSGNYKGFTFNASGITLNTARDYIMPDASGTIALTSNLSAYLPLSGGTLTGALTGTSATFSGKVLINTVTDVQGALQVNTNGGGLLVNADNSNFAILFRNTSSSNKLWDFSSFNNDFTINEGGVATRMYFQAGGNVGIGTSAPQGALEVVGLSYFTRSSQTTLFNPNYGGANTHAQLQVIGNMALAFATNGDNERMRITSGGNVGIGTSSPSTKLHIIQSLGNDALAIGETGSNMRFRIGQEASYTGNYINSTNIDLKLITYADGGSGGNIYFYTSTNSTPVERMRITSGGQTQVKGGTANYTASLAVTNATSQPAGVDIGFTAVAPNNTTNAFLYCYDSSVGCYTIWSNGTTSGRSDIRLKKNIAKATSKIDDLMKLDIVNYEWNDSIEGIKEIGLIAQNVEEVFPSLVVNGKEDEDGNSYKQVKYSVLPIINTKAIQDLYLLIQEQQAQIEELKVLIAAK
jgi:hypothetical protein